MVSGWGGGAVQGWVGLDLAAAVPAWQILSLLQGLGPPLESLKTYTSKRADVGQKRAIGDQAPRGK